jgi:TonB family protein
VVGFLRPAIVLPAWVLDWDPALRRLIVAHEREHVRAGDGRLLLGGLLLLCAAPWNLALWWQWRRLKQAVETDCDRRVLAGEPDVRRYGRLLLEVAERTRRHALPMAAFAESRSTLERRIRMMTSRQARNRAGWTLAVAVSLAAAPVALLALPAPAPVGVEAVRGAVTDWVRAQQPAQLHRGTASAEQVRDRVLMLMPPDGEVRRDTVPAGSTFTYEVSVLDTKPTILNPAEVQSLLSRLYPPDLRAAKVGGTAVMQYVIAADGTVEPSSIKVISSTDPRFARASAAAVREFRYRPGTYKGKNVRVLIQTPVTWQPGDGARAPVVDPADFGGMGVARGVAGGEPSRDSTKFSYEVARLDTKPDLLNKQEVVGLMNRFYPSALRDTGVQGKVLVQFVIQPDGSVDPTTLDVLSASNPAFGTASILVAERFRFQPGVYNGKPVRVLIQMPITWQPQSRGAGPKGFQELIPPKEPPPAIPDVDTSAPAVVGSDTVPVRDFSGIGVATRAPSATVTRASIVGRVLDREGRPVAGASVAVPALHRGAITQSDGRFAIQVPAGTHRLHVTAPGWPRDVVTAEVSLAAGETAFTEIQEPAR